MLTVLLADDNKFVLSRFAKLVDWESFGFHLAGTAIDGIEAWKEFCRLHPDIVITDVQMPGMDGIALARRIKEESPDTMIIFLSSYDEFDYARAAIDLSVQDYILKQELDKASLEKKLTEIRGTFRKQTDKRRRLASGQLISVFRMPVEELDTELLHAFFEGSYRFFILEQDHIPARLSALSGMQTEEAEYRSLLPRIPELWPEILYLVRFEPYRMIGITPAGENHELLGLKAKEFLETETQNSFSLFLYPHTTSLLEFRQEYEKYRFIFEQRYFEGTGAVLHADMYEPVSGYRKGTELETFCAALEAQEQNIALVMDHLFQPLLYHYDYQGIMELTEEILTRLERAAERKNIPFSPYDDEVFLLLGVRRIIRWLKDKAVSLTAQDNWFRSAYTTKALDYIYRNYQNPMLSVEEIAQAADLSINRLNDTFKRDLGETIGRFLTRIRMERARELLDAGEIKIPDISVETGYASASYFSYVFRKTYGISPQEYQKRRKYEK